MHRFGLDGMLQAYSGNCKHLQNRSPSSLHGKQHKLTKSQGVVLYFYNASLGQYKKWIICAGRHCHLTNHDCAQTWLQKPGLRGDPLFKSWAWPIGSVLLQFNCKQRSLFSDSSYGNLSDLPAWDAAIRSVWRLLQNKGPSGSRLNSSTVSMAKIRAGVAGRQFQPECYCYRDRTATCCVWTWNRTGVVRS